MQFSKRIRAILSLGLLITMLPLAGWSPAKNSVHPTSGEPAGTFVPEEIITRAAVGVPIDSVLSRYNLTLIEQLSGTDIYLTRTQSGVDPVNLSEQMELDLDVDFSQPNWYSIAPEARQYNIGRNDGTPSKQEYAQQWAYTKINAHIAQRSTRGAGILVAVVDTGIELTHPLLARYISHAGYDFIDNDTDPSETENGLDDDGDQVVDEAAGHGTHVSGIIHLTAPAAQILPVRVLDDDGNGPVFIVAKGIRYAVDAGARVINASLGTDADSGILQDAIHYAYDHQVIITTSAGNDNSRQDQFPAKYSDTLAVSATDIDDSKASFSNFNSYITVSAPGVSVYSTYLHSSMAWWDGTSQAAPFVAGEAALILALHPSWDRSDVRNCIRNSVVDIDPINPNYQGQLGDGRIDLARITSCR